MKKLQDSRPINLGRGIYIYIFLAKILVEKLGMVVGISSS